MYLLLLLLVLAACGRPADDDCWRGPVPIVRECPCSCEAATRPLRPSGTSPLEGEDLREGETDGAVGISTAPYGGVGTAVFPLEGGSAPEGRWGRDVAPISLQISQLMIDPTDVPDRDGEWVEIHNPSPLPVDAKGVEVAVNGATRCVLADTTIPAFGYALIARKGTPNHLPCPRLSLPNRRGEVALVRCGEVLDVRVWEKAPKGERLSGTALPSRPSPPPPG